MTVTEYLKDTIGPEWFLDTCMKRIVEIRTEIANPITQETKDKLIKEIESYIIRADALHLSRNKGSYLLRDAFINAISANKQDYADSKLRGQTIQSYAVKYGLSVNDLPGLKKILEELRTQVKSKVATGGKPQKKSRKTKRNYKKSKKTRRMR